jgi:hypothetical protein
VRYIVKFVGKTRTEYIVTKSHAYTRRGSMVWSTPLARPLDVKERRWHVSVYFGTPRGGTMDFHNLGLDTYVRIINFVQPSRVQRHWDLVFYDVPDKQGLLTALRVSSKSHHSTPATQDTTQN